MSEALPATEPATLSTSEARPARPLCPLSDATFRNAAVLGVCGLALLAAQVAAATGRLDSGVSGRLLARFDVAATVIMVISIALAARPFVAAHLDGREAPSFATHLRNSLGVLYALWIPTVIVNEAMVAPSQGPRALLLTLVLFRDPRTAGPTPGLGIGAVLFVIATAVVVVPLIGRAATVLRFQSGVRVGLLRLAGVLVVAAVAVRAILVAAGSTEPFGPLSWLPAHLDSLGAAIAIMALHESGWLAARRHTVRDSALVAIAAFMVAAFAAGLPRALLVTDGRDIQIRAVLYVVVATALTVAVFSVRATPGRAIVAVAVAAPGLVLAHEMSLIALARQYRERIDEGALGGLRLAGSALPIWLWSACLAAGIGVALTAGVLVPLRRVRTGRWPPNPYPIALAAVVAGGFLVRVATWLTIAPQKTDGGDPLFYHVTANTIANGRGFPEPLNWLDSATHIPSALHGPLYPVVLSLSSRLGGTTYVDHKFMSILIGTATVLVTALVAERLGGRRAAIAAGVLAAVYPNLWLIDSLLFPEGLFTLLTTGCVLAAYRWHDRPTLVRAAIIGGLIGLAALTRGEGLLLGVVLAMPWMLRHRPLSLRERWRHLLVAGATCVLVIAPWTIRNLRTFEEFVPLSTNGNELIVYANCDQAYSGRLIGFWSFDCQEQYRAQFGEPEGDESQKAAFWREVGVDYARDHIEQVPKVVAIRVLRQWELFRPWQTVEFSTIENRDKDSAALGLGMYYVLAAGAIAGAVMLRRRRVPLLPLGAQVLSVTLTAAYAYGTVRFRAPVEPVLCILAGVAAVPLISRAWKWAMPPDLPVDQIPVDDSTAFVLGGSGGLRRRARGAHRQLARDRHHQPRRRDPAARSVRHHGRHDGRGLHALLPGADVGGRRAERRLLAPLRPGRAPRADGMVRGVRIHARCRADVRSAAAPRDHLRLVRPHPGLGPRRGHRGRHAVDAADPHTDRTHGDGVERRPGAHAVECRVRGPRDAPARSSRSPHGVGHRRRSGGAGVDVPARSRGGRGARVRMVAVAPPRGVAAGARRRPRRCDPDVGAPGDRRPQRGVRGNVRRPGVQPARRP